DTVQLYKKAEISKQHFSKIINQEGYQPKRKTVLLLCVAMELNYDESIDLLESLGYTFSSSNIEDVIVKYFIKTKNYDLYELDETFLSYTSETLRNFD
ncbi:MAG: RNase III inhibitor, partial [Acholeplasmataceae bacterium]